MIDTCGMILLEIYVLLKKCHSQNVQKQVHRFIAEQDFLFKVTKSGNKFLR